MIEQTGWLAMYCDHHYWEDTEYFGVYPTEELAQARCDEELKLAQAHNPGFPEMNTKKACNYHARKTFLSRQFAIGAACWKRGAIESREARV